MSLRLRLALGFLGLGLLGLGLSLGLPGQLAREARLVQILHPYEPETAALLGEIGIPVGSPQLVILRDENAFLPGKTESGAALVDAGYLKEHKLYPLQLKTVRFVAFPAQILFGLLTLVSGWTAWRSRKTRTLETSGPFSEPNTMTIL